MPVQEKTRHIDRKDRASYKESTSRKGQEKVKQTVRKGRFSYTVTTQPKGRGQLEIVICENGNPERRAFTREEMLKLVAFIKKLKEENDSVPAEEVLPNLNDPSKAGGIALVGVRAKNQLTQKQLCERLDISQPELSKFETGKRPISKKLAQKIEKEFGIDYRRFL